MGNPPQRPAWVSLPAAMTASCDRSLDWVDGHRAEQRDPLEIAPATATARLSQPTLFRQMTQPEAGALLHISIADLAARTCILYYRLIRASESATDISAFA
jgi:hypothetical protein